MRTDQETPAEQPAHEVVEFRGAMSIIDPIEKVLATAREKWAGVVFDLTTTKGNKEARQARAEIVSIRTSADKAYKEWNQPILEQQRLAREKVAYIKDEVLKLETPIDEQITADEARREAERQAKVEAEAARVKTIRDRIAVIAGLPTAVLGMTSPEVDDVISDLRAVPLTEERFAEFLQEASDLVGQMVEKLEAIRNSAAAREEAERKLEAQRRELEEARLRQEQETNAERERLAAQQRELDEARKRQEENERTAQILAQERQRHAEEKAARDAADAAAQLKAQQDAFAAERAEAELVLREAEERVRAERERLRQERAAIEAKPNEAPQESKPVSDEQPQDSELPCSPAAPTVVEKPTDIEILFAVANVYGVSDLVALDWLKAVNIKELETDVLEAPF